MYTLGQAAEATGKQKSTILKALKSGRISGRKNDKGEWDIDPAELHRVYPPVSRNRSPEVKSERQETPEKTPSELIGLRVKVEALQEQVERERETVSDLRRRLDLEGEERRKLTLMLTDQREQKDKQPPPQGRFARAWAILTGKTE